MLSCLNQVVELNMTPTIIANKELEKIIEYWCSQFPDQNITTVFTGAAKKAAGKVSAIRGMGFVEIFTNEITAQCSLQLSFIQARALELSILAIYECYQAIEADKLQKQEAWSLAIKAVSMNSEAKGLMTALQLNKEILGTSARLKREQNQGTLKTKMAGLKYFDEIHLNAKNKSAAVAKVAEEFETDTKTIYAWLKWRKDF